jgi:hypothetical protein
MASRDRFSVTRVWQTRELSPALVFLFPSAALSAVFAFRFAVPARVLPLNFKF